MTSVAWSPKTLTAETAYWIGRAIGSQASPGRTAAFGQAVTAALSGPELVQQLIQGLADSGCHVSDVGLVPTPALGLRRQRPGRQVRGDAHRQP